MKKTNEVINVIQCVVMVVLLLLILSILIAMPIGQGVASAEGTSTLTPEEESALLTESDDVEGYAGKTIRDYEEIRTIPDIDYEGVELTLYTTTDDAIVKIVPKAYFMTPGDTLYIGREYGSNNMYSTVLVFDIVNSLDMAANLDTAIIKVEVLYQYEFIYLSPQEDHYTVLSLLGDFLLVTLGDVFDLFKN